MLDIEKTIKSMSLDEKIGQLFMIGINGPEIDGGAIEMLEKYHAGGVILFARNIKTAEQVKKLTGELKRRAKYPLSVSIDQEGGLVLRLTSGATVLPGNMALSACRPETYDKFCSGWGKITADELRHLGFTLNLAPVLDINNIKNPGIGARSFSDQPNLCSSLGEKIIGSVQSNGLSACAKHFPGKGNASVDAHLDLPVIDSTIDQLRNFELLPFKRAIEAGVDAIMTAHVVYRGIAGETLPATLSYRVLTTLLKDELGFSGPLITDDMEMGAIKNYYEQREACFRSFMAGADIILICHTKELQINAMQYFKEKYINGELPDERLNDALERIYRMKSRAVNYKDEFKTIDYKKNSEFAQELSDNSITLVSDSVGVIEKIAKRDFNDIVLIEPRFSAITQVEDIEEKSPLFELLKTGFAGINITHEIYDVKINNEQINMILSKIGGDRLKKSLLISITYNAHIFTQQTKLINSLINDSRIAVCAAVRNPYDLALIDGKASKIATYGFRQCNMKSIAKLILSEISSQGTLPVSLTS